MSPAPFRTCSMCGTVLFSSEIVRWLNTLHLSPSSTESGGFNEKSAQCDWCVAWHRPWPIIMSNAREQIISSIKYRGVLFRTIAKEKQERNARASLAAFTSTGSIRPRRTAATTNASTNDVTLERRATPEQLEESINQAVATAQCNNSALAIDNLSAVSNRVAPVTGSTTVYPIREVRQRAWNKLFGLLFPWQFLDERRYQQHIDRPLLESEVGDESLRGHRIYFPCAELPNDRMLQIDPALMVIMLDRTPDEMLDPAAFRRRNDTRAILLAESCCVGLLVPVDAKVESDETFWDYRYVYYFKGKYHPLPDDMLQWLVIEPVRRALQTVRLLPESESAKDLALPGEEYRLSITSARGHTRCVPMFPPRCRQDANQNVCRIHTLAFAQQEYRVLKEQLATEAALAAEAAAAAAEAARQAKISKLAEMTSFSVRSTTVASSTNTAKRRVGARSTKRKKSIGVGQRLLVDMPYVRRAENVASVRSGIQFQGERVRRDTSPSKKNRATGKHKRPHKRSGPSIAAYFIDREAQRDLTLKEPSVPGRSSSDGSCGPDRYDSADSFINDASEPDVDSSLVTSSDDDGGIGAPALIDVCAESRTIHERRRAKELERPRKSVADLVYNVMTQPRFTVLKSESESECEIAASSASCPAAMPDPTPTLASAAPLPSTPCSPRNLFSGLIISSSSSDESPRPAPPPPQPRPKNTMLASVAASSGLDERVLQQTVETDTSGRGAPPRSHGRLPAWVRARSRPTPAGLDLGDAADMADIAHSGGMPAAVESDSSDGTSVVVVSRTAGPRRPKSKPKQPRARIVPVADPVVAAAKPANPKIDSFFRVEKKSNLAEPAGQCLGAESPSCSITREGRGEPLEKSVQGGSVLLSIPLVSVIVEPGSNVMSATTATTASAPKSKPKAPKPKAPKARPPKPRPPKARPTGDGGESTPTVAPVSKTSEAVAQVGKKRSRDQGADASDKQAVDAGIPATKRHCATAKLGSGDVTEVLVREFFSTYNKQEPGAAEETGTESVTPFQNGTLAKRAHTLADMMMCIGLCSNIRVDGSYRLLVDTTTGTLVRRAREAGRRVRAMFGPNILEPKMPGE